MSFAGFGGILRGSPDGGTVRDGCKGIGIVGFFLMGVGMYVGMGFDRSGDIGTGTLMISSTSANILSTSIEMGRSGRMGKGDFRVGFAGQGGGGIAVEEATVGCGTTTIELMLDGGGNAVEEATVGCGTTITELMLGVGEAG